MNDIHMEFSCIHERYGEDIWEWYGLRELWWTLTEWCVWAKHKAGNTKVSHKQRLSELGATDPARGAQDHEDSLGGQAGELEPTIPVLAGPGLAIVPVLA